MNPHQSDKEMPHYSELQKKISKEINIRQYYFVLRSQKENLKLAEAQEEQRLLRCQKHYIELEMRKFRRKKMLTLHDLENQLLRDVSS